MAIAGKRAGPGPGSTARILAAARELFHDPGYARTSMAAIARRAGVVRATVYNNFDDKVAILRALVSEYMHGYIEIGARLREQARPDETVFEILEELVREAIAWRIRNADLRPVIDLAKHLPGSGWEEANAEADRAMLEWILAIHLANSRGGLTRPGLNIQFATGAVYSMIEAALSRFDVRAGKRRVEEVAHQLTLLQWYALYTSDPADAPLVGNQDQLHTLR